MLSTFSAISSHAIERGKAGHTSRVYLAGVLLVQRRRRSRRRGDSKTRLRQRRHTCTSVCHTSTSTFESRRLPSSTRKSNICNRTSSGSMSIESPGLHRIESTTVVAECCAKDVRRHRLVDSCRFNDVDEFLTSPRFQNGIILSMTRGVKEMTEGGAARAGVG